MISHCRYALFNEPEESVKTDRSVGPMGAIQTPTERSKGQWQSCNCSVRPDCCGRGSAPGVTNGTLEPNCNTSSVVGPPNHSGCPTSSIRFQIPGDVTVQLRPSGGSGVWHGLTTNTNTFSHARRCTNKEKNRRKKTTKKIQTDGQMNTYFHAGECAAQAPGLCDCYWDGVTRSITASPGVRLDLDESLQELFHTADGGWTLLEYNHLYTWWCHSNKE